MTELEAYAKPARGKVHVDNKVITSAGISSSIDLGLRLLELMYDRPTALKVAERLDLPTTYYQRAYRPSRITAA
jgi:transcriptional regulator GlxA family with amidase domain